MRNLKIKKNKMIDCYICEDYQQSFVDLNCLKGEKTTSSILFENLYFKK